ncbi:degV family protein [Alkaliphilus metalliredigens QYMF]|uniref:DegV family protein n=1 Tax=Alkaliphilus metalliredigens (strain QYMF) TaxID=293826 RepID=A6TU61_ALKMQ|nr:DegV family protein [Alkaliphilus metalliredigens]ABR49729.1 degV family protein [Alkaliphilus metalliredigens QYMF]
MNLIKIITDSTSDLPLSLLEKEKIPVIPLYISFDDHTYRDGIDMTPAVLYDKVKATKALPKTAAPSPVDFRNVFESYIDQGMDILYIGLSSKLSSTIQNARIAASEFPEGRIEVIDSLNLSAGIGLLVIEALDLVKTEKPLHEVATEIRHLIPKVTTYFAVDSLDYLHKGGRCSAASNFFGSILKIRPILKVDGGKILLDQKVRGKRERLIKAMLDRIYADQEKLNPKRVIINHSFCPKDAGYLKSELEKTLDIEEILMTTAGCVISSHCGPGTFSIVYSLK